MEEDIHGIWPLIENNGGRVVSVIQYTDGTCNKGPVLETMVTREYLAFELTELGKNFKYEIKEPIIALLMKLWGIGAGRIHLTRVEAKNWVMELTFTEAASPETAGDNSVPERVDHYLELICLRFSLCWSKTCLNLLHVFYWVVCSHSFRDWPSSLSAI